MRLKFTKMQGSGNDFVVFDATKEPLELSAEQVRQIADRHYGVGCDQLLLVEPPRDPRTDFFYRIFNADGSEVGQCGNGARCFYHYVRTKRLTTKQSLHVGTLKGPLTLKAVSKNRVSVDMGVPSFKPTDLPLQLDERDGLYQLEVDGSQVEFCPVALGNPHVVLWVEDVNTAPVTSLGPKVEHHAFFPERVNVSFMQVLNRKHIRLRVYERGSGETLACGSGACASALCGMRSGVLDSEVSVLLPGGELMISWAGGDAPVWMTGPAETVFEGHIDL